MHPWTAPWAACAVLKVLPCMCGQGTCDLEPCGAYSQGYAYHMGIELVEINPESLGQHAGLLGGPGHA